MSLNNSRASYHDCFSLFDRALDAERGIRVEVPDLGSATYLRMRLHHARTIDRRENKATYPDRDHPLHNRSVYDILVVRLEPGPPSWVYLDKVKVEMGRIEDIAIDAPVLRQALEAPRSPEIVAGEFEVVETQKQIESPERLKRRV